MESQRISHVNKRRVVFTFVILLLFCSWSQVVTKTTDHYELFLKVLLTPSEPVPPFVQSYLLLLTDFGHENFCKFLEIKGITRRSDQQAFLDEFYKHVPPTPQELTDNPKTTNSFSSPTSTNTTTNTTPQISLFSRLKLSFNVVNAMKRSYTRPIRNSSSDGFLK